MRLQPLALIRG